jgi:hypothetical protein
MNLLFDAVIQIDSHHAADGGHEVKRTILGSTQSIVLALVATMQLEPDFAEAVKSAVRVYSDPRSKFKSHPPGRPPR